MGVKAQILICVGGLTVHRGADGAIIFPVQEDVKEGELSVWFLLHRELYARVDTVQMVVKGVNQVRGECCACVINVSPLKPWWLMEGR